MDPEDMMRPELFDRLSEWLDELSEILLDTNSWLQAVNDPEHKAQGLMLGGHYLEASQTDSDRAKAQVEIASGELKAHQVTRLLTRMGSLTKSLLSFAQLNEFDVSAGRDFLQGALDGSLPDVERLMDLPPAEEEE